MEVQNAYSYPAKDGKGEKQARPGVFLCVPGSYPIDVTELDFADLANKLKKNKLAQAIIAENIQAANQ